MLQPQAGTWYIVVTCDGCESTIFLFPDLNEGKRSLKANYIVTCPRCGHKGSYTARHYFHQQMGREDQMVGGGRTERRTRPTS